MRKLSGNIKTYGITRITLGCSKIYRIDGLGDFIRARVFFEEDTKSHHFNHNGAVALLHFVSHDLEYEEMKTMFGLYFVYRNRVADDGSITIECDPLYDEDGNQIVIKSDELTETPFAIINHQTIPAKQTDGRYKEEGFVSLSLVPSAQEEQKLKQEYNERQLREHN